MAVSFIVLSGEPMSSIKALFNEEITAEYEIDGRSYTVIKNNRVGKYLVVRDENVVQSDLDSDALVRYLALTIHAVSHNKTRES